MFCRWILLAVSSDLGDGCILPLDENVPSNYAGDIFSNSDSYPTLSHMLSSTTTQASLPVMQPQQLPSTVQHHVASNCHITVTSSQHQSNTVSTQPRQNLQPLGREQMLICFDRSCSLCSCLTALRRYINLVRVCLILRL